MMRSALVCVLFTLCVLVSFPLHATVAVGNLTQPVSLAGPWQFKTGDDLAWAAADLDDSDWQTTTVPADWPTGQPGYSGMLWYRLNLQLDLSQPSVHATQGALAVTIGNVASAYEIYAGGDKLGTIGKLPPAALAVHDRRQTWSIPVSAVGADGQLIIALRVWRNPAAPASWQTGLYSGDFLLGNVGELRERMLQKALLPNLVLAVLYFVFGLYHLLIARRNPVLKEFFWFSLLSMALAGYTFETSQAKFFIDIPYVWHKKVEYALLYIAPYLIGQTLLAVTRTRANKLIHCFHAIFGVLCLSVVLVPGSVMQYLTLTAFQYLGAVWALSMAAIMSWRAYRGSRSARWVVVLLLMLLAATINDAILETPIIGSGNILYIVLALMLSGIALMMAERYTEILKQLAFSVDQRTAELVDANRELEAAVETKGQFLANMSHEMRTPMNAILGLTHLGLKTDLSTQQRDYFTKVEQSAEGLQAIIDSILDFSKLEEGQLECVKEPFSPSSLLENSARIWAQRAEEAGLDLAVECAPGIPVALLGDARRLQQVMGNLISNAIKFTEQGRVAVTLQLLESSDASVRLRFAVSDTGVGIVEDQREQLFTAFTQADNTMTREYGGTGLGLSIAQDLVQLMGGHIDVQSTPGKGSTFSFDLTLPVTAEAVVNEAATDQLHLAPIRGARILLVDDSDLNLQVAGELLRQAQLYVEVAHDGREAVDKVNSAHYDCVLMDVQMPVMDGYTATENIRSQPAFADLPVLAMTANAMPQDRVRGAEAGMNAYIPKPIDPADLYRALLQWIEPGERDYDEESFAVGQASAETLAELPGELPGINISEGLARVGGNTALYLSLLQDLCKDYADAARRIQSMLENGDADGAGQLAHKLRGIANNLGAAELGAAAEAVELPLKSGDTVNAAALQQLQQALAQTADSQATLLPLMSMGDESSGALDDAERRHLLGELVQAVAENNPEAIDLVEKLLLGMLESDAGYVEFVAAKDALDMYDFAAAAELLPAAASAAGLSD